ncbi:preprotein translocase subunit SecG [Candidatus Aerophobetes bacterium]|uniref:Protein-export membrane protein SecG n=1 Tax=Aerophobetes bacterium TaxID=2030807 RepID=A0A662D8A8_UNCAE|nr:MAG: preprotein translocase subunit SecG [Candidatus Aerophobetes bacterium]
MGVFFILQVIVCVLLIGAILLQVGRGASTGAAFGGGVGTFFGPSGEVSFLGKVIIVLTVIFIVNTVFLYIFSHRAPPPLPASPEKTSLNIKFDKIFYIC